MPSVFHTSTPLAASAETVFGFHSAPSNLTVVMPSTVRLVSLKTDGPAKEGRLVSETGVRFYLTLLFKDRHCRIRKWALAAKYLAEAVPR
jgi:hypothetical protein